MIACAIHSIGIVIFRQSSHYDMLLTPTVFLFHSSLPCSFPFLLVIPTSFIIFKCFYYAFSYTTVDCSLSYISRVCAHAVSALLPEEGSLTQPQLFHVFTTMNILMSKQNVNGSCERGFNHKLFFSTTIVDKFRISTRCTPCADPPKDLYMCRFDDVVNIF